MDKNQVPSAVHTLCGTLRSAGFAAYPVGGCVRDMLLGRKPGDWDVTTAALPEQVQALFRHTVPTGIRHGTVTVLLEDMGIEVTTFRRETGYADGRHPDAVTFDAGLTEDLARRDFTVNAMALDENGEVVDPFGGREDLTAGLIRCVGDPDRRFGEDALRMLRAIRFAAQLGFTIEHTTAAAMEQNARRTFTLSGERIKAEMEKILLSPRPEWVGKAVEAGLLNHLFDRWPKAVNWLILREVPPLRNLRWRAFCAQTGFPVASLPVERALRRAVEHPELEVIAALKISGGELCAMGLKGAQVSAMQRRLAAHIMAHPEDNSYDRLSALAKVWKNERENI